MTGFPQCPLEHSSNSSTNLDRAERQEPPVMVPVVDSGRLAWACIDIECSYQIDFLSKREV